MVPLSQHVRNWPCASLQRNQLSHKSQDRDFFGISVELVIPTAVELSGWRGLGGCFHPMSVRVFRSGPLLTIAQIMNYVVSSAAEAEMTALFQTAKEMVHSNVGWTRFLTKRCGHQLGFLALFHWQSRSPSVPRGSYRLIDRE